MRYAASADRGERDDMTSPIQNGSHADCFDPLLWHLIEARETAISANLVGTTEVIELAIVLASQEFKCEGPIARPRMAN